jgi:uncharacterized protein (DUF362 family)
MFITNDHGPNDRESGISQPLGSFDCWSYTESGRSLHATEEAAAIDRRNFIKNSVLTGASLVSASALEPFFREHLSVRAAATDRSTIVLARDSRLRPSGSSMDQGRLADLLDRAMKMFFDRDDPVEPWKMVVRPNEVVGLKVNCLSGRGNSTSVELVEVVCERLQQAGVRSDNIIIWDRLNKDLDGGGFRVKNTGGGVRCFGNDVLGFESELSTYGQAGSLLCKTLTRACDCVINMPVVKDHSIAGVTIALKNMFGAIHNPNKYHLNTGDPYIPDVYMLRGIREKTRLVVCDATTIQYEGGPSYLPHWAWAFDGLMVGRDPVALDHVGWQLIEQKRAAQGMKSLGELGRRPVYLETAAEPARGLGTNNPEQIDLVEI